MNRRSLLKCSFSILPVFFSCEISASWNDKYYKRKGYKGWKYIVIHHSATSSGSAASFHKYHTDQGYGGLCYHFVIGNGRGSGEGKIETGFRWKDQIAGTHCTINSWEYNIFGIGICLVGNFNNSNPKRKQMTNLIKLIKKLKKENNIPNNRIIGHRDVPWDDNPDKFEQTACPGKKISLKDIRAKLI